jgi:hypothetical protein
MGLRQPNRLTRGYESKVASSRKSLPPHFVLGSHTAIEALKTLVMSGCDEKRVLSILTMIRQDWPGLDTSEARTGMSRKRLKAAIGRIRGVADEIARFNRERFGLLLLPGSGLSHWRDLPDTLRIYAEMLEQPSSLLGQARYPTLHAYKFYLTQHVIESTAGPHDEEVAALIDDALPEYKRVKDRKHDCSKTYDAVAHKQWRLASYKDIALALDERKK